MKNNDQIFDKEEKKKQNTRGIKRSNSKSFDQWFDRLYVLAFSLIAVLWDKILYA